MGVADQQESHRPPSIIVQGSAPKGGQNRLFHMGDFLIRQEIEVTRAFPCRKSAIVLQAEANEDNELKVREWNFWMARRYVFCRRGCFVSIFPDAGAGKYFIA